MVTTASLSTDQPRCDAISSSTRDSPRPVVLRVRQTNSFSNGSLSFSNGIICVVNIGRNSRGGPGSMMRMVLPVRNFLAGTSITRPGAVPCAFISTVEPSGTSAWTLVLSGMGRLRELKKSVMRASTSSLQASLTPRS